MRTTRLNSGPRSWLSGFILGAQTKTSSLVRPKPHHSFGIVYRILGLNAPKRASAFSCIWPLRSSILAVICGVAISSI